MRVSVFLCRFCAVFLCLSVSDCLCCYGVLHARHYASAGLCDSNVSVRPSVTSRYCVKTKKASVMISSPSGSPTILVFWCKISS